MIGDNPVGMIARENRDLLTEIENSQLAEWIAHLHLHDWTKDTVGTDEGMQDLVIIPRGIEVGAWNTVLQGMDLLVRMNSEGQMIGVGTSLHCILHCHHLHTPDILMIVGGGMIVLVGGDTTQRKRRWKSWSKDSRY